MNRPGRLPWPLRWIVVLLGGITIACGGGSHATPSPDVPGTVNVDPSSTARATARLAPSLTPRPAATVTPTPMPSPTLAATVTPPRPTATPSPPAPADDAPVIVLDPGHDLTRPGALGIEYQVVLRAALVIQAALEAAGYRVFLTRTDNDTIFTADQTLLPPNAGTIHPGYDHAYAHASKALLFNPDMIFVLHFNGHNDPNVAGVEVYYCEHGGAQNLLLAEILRDELVTSLRAVGYEPPSTNVLEDLTVGRGGRHFPSLGNVYDSDNVFQHTRYAGIPVALTEPLYMTNATEYALIQDDATHLALAQAYVRAADRYFGR